MRNDETGSFLGMSRAEYEGIDRVNWSTLKYMKRSPAHYRAAILEKPEADSDAMRLGRATHVAVLEPERFASSHAVWEGGKRYGKEWDKFREAHPGVDILKSEEYQEVCAMADAARSNEHAAKYLRGGAPEVTLLWNFVEPGVNGFEVKCKGRIDFAAHAGAIVDLKTTRDASPDAFGRQAWSLDYCTQAAFYVDGYAYAHGGEVLPYVIVAVEKDAPHVVQVYRLPEPLVELGRATYRGLLARLAACRRSACWPGYVDGEAQLQLPPWAQESGDAVAELGLVVN